MKVALHIWTEVNKSSFPLFQHWYSEHVLGSNSDEGKQKARNFIRE